MPMLHDPLIRSRLESRLNALRPESPRKWGSMTPGQMVWHVNQFLAFSLGEATAERSRSLVPAPLFRFLLLYMPWPKSAPTHPTALAKDEHDLEAERARCLALIGRFVSRPVDGPWPEDPVFGSVTGNFTSRLQAKHLEHHFKQFGI
jgi:hypothetical protein